MCCPWISFLSSYETQQCVENDVKFPICVYIKSAHADDNNKEEEREKKNCFSDLLCEAIWNDKAIREWECEREQKKGPSMMWYACTHVFIGMIQMNRRNKFS